MLPRAAERADAKLSVDMADINDDCAVAAVPVVAGAHSGTQSAPAATCCVGKHQGRGGPNRQRVGQ